MIPEIPLGRVAPSRKNPTKIKIEFNDRKGAKYSFTVEGPSKENMAKIMDFVESMSENKAGEQSDHDAEQLNMDTNFAKVYGLIESQFRFGSFNSTDVLEAYEDEFQVPTTLSTISTYLARLADRGLLTRSRNGAGWIYRLVRIEQQREPMTEEDVASQINFIRQ